MWNLNLDSTDLDYTIKIIKLSLRQAEEKTDYMYIRSPQESNLAGGIASVSSGKIRFRQYTLTHDKYFWTRPR